MKTNTTISYQVLTAKELFELTAVVKETLVTVNQTSNTRAFSSADLWNIQRRSKTAFKRRQLA